MAERKVENKEITIYDLFKYHPTVFQDQYHKFRRKQPYTTLVAHRRFGKTECNLMELFQGALTCTKRLPIYQYIAPSLKQAKKIAWDKLKYYCSVAKDNGLECIKISESDTKIIFTHRGNSNPATIELCGWEEPESLRGPYTDGMVIDEAADMKRGIWGKVLAPRLADRKGWATITGTVKGLDQFFDFYRKGVPGPEKDPFWGSLYFPECQTHGKIPWLDESGLHTLRSGMTETEWRQEMELDWNANNDNCLISLDAIGLAMKRTPDPTTDMSVYAKILGVDCARFGDDPNTLVLRQGPKVWQKREFRHVDGHYLAEQILRYYEEERFDAIMVDGTGGFGASVIDALRSKRCPCPVFEILFNSKAIDDDHYYNLRAEMYDKMKRFIERDGCLPESEELRRCLNAPQFDYEHGRLKLEDKKEIRKRIGRSTDYSDALALTFARKVYPSGAHASSRRNYANMRFVQSDLVIG